LIVWALAQSRGDGHRSLVTPERVFSEYNADLIFFFDNKSGFIGELLFSSQSELFEYFLNCFN